jgi:RNA-directed DNA polymerase
MFHATEAGTPQGGVISPLLCNIGLWGLDFEIYDHLIETRKPADRNLKPFVSFVCSVKKRCRDHSPSVGFVQYADDFVIICENRDYLNRVMEVLPDILEKRGLVLSQTKTRVVEFHKGESFKFLGFVFNKWKSGIHDKEYKVTFYADPDKVYSFCEKIREWTKTVRLFEYSNPKEFSSKANYLRMMVNGWLNYYKWAMDASYGFMKFRREFDNILYKAYEDVHRHRSSWHDFQERYIIRAMRRGRMVDKYKLGAVVFGVFDISTHVTWKKVQGGRSPFDGDTAYWSNRNSIMSGTVTEKVYKKQNGVCPLCNASLQWFESWERHRLNGDKYDNRLANIQLVHLRCHREILYPDNLELGSRMP